MLLLLASVKTGLLCDNVKSSVDLTFRILLSLAEEEVGRVGEVVARLMREPLDEDLLGIPVAFSPPLDFRIFQTILFYTLPILGGNLG